MQISLNLDRTVSPHILLKKNCSDLLSFPVSRLYLLNGFDFYFDLFWMAWHLKPAIRHGNGAVWKPEEFRTFGFWFSCGLKTFGRKRCYSKTMAFRWSSDSPDRVFSQTQIHNDQWLFCFKFLLRSVEAKHLMHVSELFSNSSAA